MGKMNYKWAIFHSYVSLPEGIFYAPSKPKIKAGEFTVGFKRRWEKNRLINDTLILD
jgi:hypothetical protein